MVLFQNYKFADVGYYINLDKRTDRKQILEQQLDALNITGVQRFSANSSTNSAPLNCKLSHFEIYKKFLSTDYDTLLILEDDCKFLPYLFENIEEVHKNIFSSEFDIFWLGCKNRRWPKQFKNKCFQVQSVSHTQSYIIRRKMCQYIVEKIQNNELGLCIDELLCLVPYGYEVAYDPHKYRYYDLDSPLDHLPTIFTALCYEKPFTTQYASYSNIVEQDVDYSDYITAGFPLP